MSARTHQPNFSPISNTGDSEPDNNQPFWRRSVSYLERSVDSNLRSGGPASNASNSEANKTDSSYPCGQVCGLFSVTSLELWGHLTPQARGSAGAE
jgi:hypothetical protein